MSSDQTEHTEFVLKIPPTARGRARWRKIVDAASRLFEERGGAADGRRQILGFVEENTNVPLAAFFRRAREKYRFEFVMSDEDVALVMVRIFRGTCLETAF